MFAKKLIEVSKTVYICFILMRKKRKFVFQTRVSLNFLCIENIDTIDTENCNVPYLIDKLWVQQEIEPSQVNTLTLQIARIPLHKEEL
jgi:hypothetical protein